MLYLTRKKGQTIIVNGEIEITVVELTNKTVKLGVIFPRGSTVLRKEIHDRIVQENLAASSNFCSNDELSYVIKSINMKADE